MEIGILQGFSAALSLVNLGWCFLGVLLGTMVGVLPGLGPAPSVAMLLPLTLGLQPTSALILLAGVFYGATYGGSTTSILVNIPGETSSVVTCFDGFPMTKQGRAGQALAISAIGSFIAGTAGVMLLSVAGPILADFALRFGAPEYFCLVLFSLTALMSVSGRSLLKGVAMGAAGMVLACVGLDPLCGRSRLTFGTTELMLGLEIIPVLMGLFGISEVLVSAEEGLVAVYEGSLGRLIPRGKELIKGLKACLRGTGLGLSLGLLPGMMGPVVTFIAYDIEKRVSKYPEQFGTGVIEGVASPEAANNAAAQAHFIPLMALGIPATPGFAILLAAFMLMGLTPGPLLFTKDAVLTWTIIASMYIGNVMLLVLNLPLVSVWARISLIPYRFIGPFILVICTIGAYSVRNSVFDVMVATVFGLVGYGMKVRGWPAAPMILGFILGPMLERFLRGALMMSGGSVDIFFTRPIAVGLLALTVVFLFFSRKLVYKGNSGSR